MCLKYYILHNQQNWRGRTDLDQNTFVYGRFSFSAIDSLFIFFILSCDFSSYFRCLFSSKALIRFTVEA